MERGSGSALNHSSAVFRKTAAGGVGGVGGVGVWVCGSDDADVDGWRDTGWQGSGGGQQLEHEGSRDGGLR